MISVGMVLRDSSEQQHFLDDVLSELDSSRQTYLLDSIHDIQTMITCTGLDDFISHRFHINKIFQVVNGSICE